MLEEVEPPISLCLLGQPEPGLRHVDEHRFRARLPGGIRESHAVERVLTVMVGFAHGVASAAIPTTLNPEP